MTMLELAPVAMPTSGSARRRAKSSRNRAKGCELESIWALITGHLPPHAIAVSVCGCGYRSWLMPGVTAEEHETFDRETADHDDSCALIHGGAW